MDVGTEQLLQSRPRVVVVELGVSSYQLVDELARVLVGVQPDPLRLLEELVESVVVAGGSEVARRREEVGVDLTLRHLPAPEAVLYGGLNGRGRLAPRAEVGADHARD